MHLLQLVPFLYGKRPALLQLGSGLPYSKIIAAVRRDAAAALIGVVATLLFVVAKLLKVA